MSTEQTEQDLDTEKKEETGDNLAPENGNSGDSSDEYNEEMSTAELNLPTEEIEEPEDEALDEDLSKAKALKKIADYIKWNVSIKKILQSGLERFENTLYKQFLLHKDSQKISYGYKILGKSDVTFSPPYKGARIARKMAQLKAQEYELSDEKFRVGIERLSKKLKLSVPENLSIDESDSILEDLYFRYNYRLISERAEKYKWVDFHKPNNILDDRAFYNSVTTLTLHEVLFEIKEGISYLLSNHQFQVPNAEALLGGTDLAEAIVEKEQLDEQKVLGQKVLNGKKLLPKEEIEKLGEPVFPLKAEKVEEFLSTIHHRLSIITEQKRKKESILRLVRIGLTSILTVWIGLWEIQLFSDIQSLQLRGADIGLSLKTPPFPYTPQQVSSMKYYVEKQESLVPRAEAIKQSALKKGLIRLPIQIPYTTKQVNRWYKAVESFSMVRVPAGNVKVGSYYGNLDESPVFTALISSDFYMMDSEVSQAMFVAVMGRNPSVNRNIKGKCLDCPVTNVSWYDAIRFANKLSKISGLKPCYSIKEGVVSWPKGTRCKGFRLPTEAEWEYSARAQTAMTYAGGVKHNNVAWFLGNSAQSLQPSKKLQANDFGLFDLNGNVWEWCWDRYGSYARGTYLDPIGNRKGSERVRRGGAYDSGVHTVSSRSGLDPQNKERSVGFRLIRTISKGNVKSSSEK